MSPIPVETIVGEQLSSVEFVQDYLQLHFDGPTLTLFGWPTLNLHGKTHDFAKQSYRDALCQMIGRKVTTASLQEGMALDIHFGPDIEVHLLLNPDDENGHFRVSSDSHAPLLDF